MIPTPAVSRQERIFRLGLLTAALLCVAMGIAYLLAFQDPVRFLLDTWPGWLTLLTAGGVCGYAVWRSRLSGTTAFMPLWLEGLGTAWFAAFLTGLYTYVLMEWADPQLISAHRESLVQPILSSGASPEVQEESLQRLRQDYPMLFNSLRTALRLFPVVGGVGTVISLVVAGLVRSEKP